VIYSSVRFGVKPDMNALATVLLVMSTTAVLFGATPHGIADRALGSRRCHRRGTRTTGADVLVISITDVSASLRRRRGARRCHLEIRPQRVLLPAGARAGCGKTTLLRILAGLDEPDNGTVTLDGADLLTIPTHRRPINLMFQSYALFPHLTWRSNVGYGLAPGEVAQRRDPSSGSTSR
jgi:ABC-type glutathione transport system ATPase component